MAWVTVLVRRVPTIRASITITPKAITRMNKTLSMPFTNFVSAKRRGYKADGRVRTWTQLPVESVFPVFQSSTESGATTTGNPGGGSISKSKLRVDGDKLPAVIFNSPVCAAEELSGDCRSASLE